MSKPVEIKAVLPTDPADRKLAPMCTGLLDYFPLALAEVARVSKAGNDQHNLGQDLHWERGKSQDHADCILRHLADRGLFDSDGQRHSAKNAWRALALLEEELEAAGGNMGRASWVDKDVKGRPGHLCVDTHNHPLYGGFICDLPEGHTEQHHGTHSDGVWAQWP